METIAGSKNSNLYMSKDMRAAEPIQVSTFTMLIAWLGTLLVSVGFSIHGWIFDHERVHSSLLSGGMLLIAFSLLSHFKYHRDRFGAPAILMFILAFVAASAVWVPYIVDPNLRGTSDWPTYSNLMWGVGWLLGSLSIFLVLQRKESQLENNGRTSQTTIHASFTQLTLSGVGTLIYSFAFLNGPYDGSQLHGIFTALGPLLIAIAIISHFQQLKLRLGSAAVILLTIGAAGWGIKNLLLRVVTDLHLEAHWVRYLTSGTQGAIFFISSVVCILVILHKRNSKSISARVSKTS